MEEKKNQPQALICSLFLTKATSFSEGSFHCSGDELHVGKTEKQFVVVKSPRLRPGPSAQRYSYAFCFFCFFTLLNTKKQQQYFLMNHPYIQQHTYSGAHQTNKLLHNFTLLLCVDQSEPSLKGKVNALLKTAQQRA